jgi:hypothetical protein
MVILFYKVAFVMVLNGLVRFVVRTREISLVSLMLGIW